ncbi:MAG: hypothetical protein AAGA75_08950 [Cyanobacteria bacterium P01_E01_bin.6]
MDTNFIITLDTDLKAALEAAATTAGTSAEDIVHKAIEDYLFSCQFRTLREHLMEKLKTDYTDDEIFELVS